MPKISNRPGNTRYLPLFGLGIGSIVRKRFGIFGTILKPEEFDLPDSEIAKVTFETVKSHRIVPKPAGSYAEAKERRNGFPVHWFAEWEDHSLQLIDEWEQSYMLTFTHEEWCGKIRSVSWMTHADENIRKKVTDDLFDRLAKYEPVLRIPHKYSVVVLRNGIP